MSTLGLKWAFASSTNGDVKFRFSLRGKEERLRKRADGSSTQTPGNSCHHTIVSPLLVYQEITPIQPLYTIFASGFHLILILQKLLIFSISQNLQMWIILLNKLNVNFFRNFFSDRMEDVLFPFKVNFQEQNRLESGDRDVYPLTPSG